MYISFFQRILGSDVSCTTSHKLYSICWELIWTVWFLVVSIHTYMYVYTYMQGCENKVKEFCT